MQNVDSQSVKTVDQAGERGYDAGKKVSGRKRHLAVDCLLILAITGLLKVTTRRDSRSATFVHSTQGAPSYAIGPCKNRPREKIARLKEGQIPEPELTPFFKFLSAFGPSAFGFLLRPAFVTG